MAIGVAIVMLLFQAAYRYPFRIDLTEEGRYTVSAPTKKILRQVEGQMTVEVYLAGELPSNFQRFQKAVREMLDEMEVHVPGTMDIKFIDPSQASSGRARNQFYQGLMDQGLQGTNLNYTKDGQSTRKLVFPGAIISYGNQEIAVNLLRGNRTAGLEQIINQSIEGLEYELASNISGLVDPSRKRVGLVTGHDEPDSTQLAALTNLVLSKYDLFRVHLPSRNEPVTGYDMLLITKPSSRFSDQEKYLLDQFIMNGGRVAFFLDALRVNMDSASGEGTVAIPYETNLQDLLFRYGARINLNYVVDLNCGEFPVVAGNMGDQPQIQMLPWPYFPVISNYGVHPVTKNLDAALVRFASVIDTVKAVGVSKTPIMFTSENSKIMGAPVVVSFNDLRSELLPDKFHSGPQPVAYLLEGTFTSLYKNRIVPSGISKQGFLEESLPNRVIVVSDGDLVRNEISPRNNSPLELGVDPYSQRKYANEALVMNIIDYLLDEEGLIGTRGREVKIRPLDKGEVKEDKTFWQVVNLVLPIILLIAFGIVKQVLRKKKNQRA